VADVRSGVTPRATCGKFCEAFFRSITMHLKAFLNPIPLHGTIFFYIYINGKPLCPNWRLLCPNGHVLAHALLPLLADSLSAVETVTMLSALSGAPLKDAPLKDDVTGQ
jgi:hypothetical protein